MATSVCGFMVVRTPQKNADEAGRGAFPNVTPCRADVCYGGIDRMPWFDLDEAFYKADIPDEMNRARQELSTSNVDFSGINLTSSIDLASAVLRFSNREVCRNEIIAVRSPTLNNLKGSFEVPFGIEWIGVDLVNIGNMSLLREGLFGASRLLDHHFRMLNKQGLFSAEDPASAFYADYRTHMEYGELEEISKLPYSVDCVWVGIPDIEGA